MLQVGQRMLDGGQHSEITHGEGLPGGRQLRIFEGMQKHIVGKWSKSWRYAKRA